MNTKKLKDLRQQFGYSQSQTANFLHISQSVYSTYETGKADPPTKMLKDIATLFNVSSDYLLDLAER